MDPQNYKILFVEDLSTDVEIAKRVIRKEAIQFTDQVVQTEEAFREALIEFQPDIIISDYAMPRFDGMCALEIAQAHSERIPFIILTGSMNEETAVKCMKAGADDYVIKEKITRLPFAVLEVIKKHQVEKEKAKAEKEVQRNLERLRALREIESAISSSLKLDHVLEIILDEVSRIIPFDVLSIQILEGENLRVAACRGYQEQSPIVGLNFPLNQVFPNQQVIESQEPLSILDIRKEYPDYSMEGNFYPSQEIRSWLGVPLVAKGESIGMLSFNRMQLDPFTEDEIELAASFSNQAAIAIENATLYSELKHAHHEVSAAYESTLEGWANALELKDAETQGHSKRVVVATLEIARKIGVPEDQLADYRRGALLHDIGKMGIPDKILQKPGPLTDEEWEIMRQHPAFAYQMLSSISFLQNSLEIPYCHHEKWDGTGYPQGLKGEEIPLSARIFAVVDVWDALLSDRPYRKAWSVEETRAYIRDQAGKHFDPKVVELFLDMTIDQER